MFKYNDSYSPKSIQGYCIDELIELFLNLDLEGLDPVNIHDDERRMSLLQAGSDCLKGYYYQRKYRDLSPKLIQKINEFDDFERAIVARLRANYTPPNNFPVDLAPGLYVVRRRGCRGEEYQTIHEYLGKAAYKEIYFMRRCTEDFLICRYPYYWLGMSGFSAYRADSEDIIEVIRPIDDLEGLCPHTFGGFQLERVLEGKATLVEGEGYKELKNM